MLGPTKIYLAVQPNNASPETGADSNPPPLAPVQQSPVTSTVASTTGQVQTRATPVVQQVCNSPEKAEKVIVECINKFVETIS